MQAIGQWILKMLVELVGELVRAALVGWLTHSFGLDTTPDKAESVAARPMLCMPREYTVLPGDTLEAVAERFALTTAELLQLNPELEPRPARDAGLHSLTSGEVLVVLPERAPTCDSPPRATRAHSGHMK